MYASFHTKLQIITMADNRAWESTPQADVNRRHEQQQFQQQQQHHLPGPLDEARSIHPTTLEMEGTDSRDASSEDEEDDDSVSPASPGIDFKGPAMDAKANVNTENGRISLLINAKQKLPSLPPDYALPVREYGVDLTRPLQVPQLQIVMFIVGSRGDVQPYLALALQLIVLHGHRVRIATHDVFAKFVLEQAVYLRNQVGLHGQTLERSLEFYGIGGDPKDLMAYMVKNPGLMPGRESLMNGDIGRKKKMIKEMLGRFYLSTFSPCPQTGEPFAVDAIISNPPAFAHIHVAEALGVPLTMTFTMPWSATTAFSHPLVVVDGSNAASDLTNYITFAMAEALTWQGLKGVINKFRTKHLSLERLSLAAGASVLDRLKVPYIYCWSTNLIPKPADWMQHIDITGFLFLPNDAYQPDPKLAAFLADGPPPMYIGFGSIVVDDPNALTTLLLGAIAQSDTRVLLSSGWSNIGGDSVPDNVFLLGDCPHDWLFSDGRVSAVCIHGGAGTTAIALRNGLPVIVVPFFGDQPFWGACIAQQGAGPPPIPFKQLTTANLAEAIKFALSSETRAAARLMGERIRNEDGPRQFIDAFHAHLPLLHMRCDIDPSLVAVWWSEKHALRLSAQVASVLVDAGRLQYSALEVWRPSTYDTERLATDPITGGAFAVLKAMSQFGEGFFQIFMLRPDRAVLMMATAPLRMISNTLHGLTEGLEELPKLYGTEEKRKRTKVKDTKSGLIAAGEGFVYGLSEGLTGMVKEPMAGRERDGAKGFWTGLARATANLAVQPAAGILGLASHPVKGITKTMENKFKRNYAQTVLAKPREQLSKQALEHISAEDRLLVVSRFDGLLVSTKQRKLALASEAQRYMDMRREEARSNAELQRQQATAAGSALQPQPSFVQRSASPAGSLCSSSRIDDLPQYAP